MVGKYALVNKLTIKLENSYGNLTYTTIHAIYYSTRLCHCEMLAFYILSLGTAKYTAVRRSIN